MKKIIFFGLFTLIILPICAFDSADIDFSIAWQPVTFFSKVNSDGPTILFDEKAERGQYYTYQSSLKFRSGLNIGFGLGFDSEYNKNNNIVGIMSDILATMGYKRFAVRTGHGKSDNINKTTVDLLIDTYGIDYYTPAPWYMFAGINYTYLESPLPYSPVGGDDYNIQAVTQLYGIILGSDLFSYFINKNKINTVEFYPWWDGWINLGIGKTIYQDTEEFVYDIRVSYTGGVLMGGGSKVNWCLGLGFNLDGGVTNLLHYGFVTRFGIKM